MKIYNDIEQNTPEWADIRTGVITASCFDKIVTPTGKPSAQSDNYANRILAEQLIGKPIQEWEGNGWSDRGHALEDEAASYYSAINDVDCKKVGFITDDNGVYGCSPDRLVGEDGLLEIKCPAVHTHMAYLLDNKELEKSYRIQVQGQLFVTGRKWCDLTSYFPELPEVTIRCNRNEVLIKTIEEAIFSLLLKIEEKRKILIGLGMVSEKKDETGRFILAG